MLRQNPLMKLMAASWNYAGARRGHLVLATGLLLGGQVAQLAKPWLFGQSFNAIQSGGPELMGNVVFWLLLYGAMDFVFWALHGPARVMERNTAFEIRRNFFMDNYASIRQLPLKWHQEHHSGNTINRLRKANDALFGFAQDTFVLTGTVMGLVGPIVVLFWLSWKIALITLTVNVVTLFLLRYFDVRIMHWVNRENEVEHKYASTLFDYISNMTTIITLRLGQRTQGELAHKLGEMYANFRKHVVLNETKYFALNIAISALEVGIIIAYIYQQLSMTGTVMVGTTIAVFRYLNTLTGAYYNFAGVYQNLQRQFTDYRALESIRAYYHLIPQQVVPTVTHQRWKTLAIEGLNYAHDTESQQGRLQDVSLTLQRGERVALIGESGSGKSTLLALLRNLYEPDSVVLKIDGKKAKSYRVLRGMTTLIPQDPEIFENTIEYNICVGLEHGEAELTLAITLAKFDKALARLPNGLATDIREKGVNLSGGEKQRLAVARGLYAAKDSSLLLLDEPTSSVDSRNEAEIYEQVFAAYPDKTIISSIHRLHLLPRFDRIVYMAEGRIVQTGTFAEMIKKEPFRGLWRKHTKGHK